MERKLGINSGCLPDIAGTAEELKRIRDAGFDWFSSASCLPEQVCMLKNEGERIGLTLGFLHAPTAGINNFWREDLEYLPLWKQVIASIDSAAACDIPTVVMHLSSGWTAPALTDIGFSRFDRLVEYAIDKKVGLAFENVRKLGNLAAIMERYERIPNVGFCYDCGHEHCYTETVHFLDFLGKRTFCTSIHDNFGRDREDPRRDTDEHLMPFDGNVDYRDMMARLNRYGYSGALTLQLVKKGEYAQKSDAAFLAVAFERLNRIARL